MNNIRWLPCDLCGATTPHKRMPDGSYQCAAASHEKTRVALNRINKGEDLKKKPKGRK